MQRNVHIEIRRKNSAVPLRWETGSRLIILAVDFNCCLNTYSVLDIVLLVLSHF